MTAKIYTLQHEGVVRYVGKTTKILAKRLKEHLQGIRGKRRDYRTNWLRSLALPPDIELLTYCLSEEANVAERNWIATARAYGCRLVNGTDGGEGCLNPSTEVREKLSVAQRRRFDSPGAREIHSATHYALWEVPEHREKMSEAHRNPAAETRENMAMAARALWKDPEHQEKMSAAHRGRKDSAETREKKAAAHREKWKNPAYREKMAAMWVRRQLGREE